MMDWAWVFVSLGTGALCHWVSGVIAEAWTAWRARRAMPINRFRGVNFPPPGDAAWIVMEGTAASIGPVTIDGCRLLCHGVWVDHGDRVVRYRKAIEAAARERRLQAALDGLHEFEMRRAREMLS